MRLLDTISPIILLAFLFGFPPYITEATRSPQTDIQNSLDAYMTEQMERLNIPGAAIGVVQNDRVVYLQGYGNAGKGREATPQTPFLLASLSKSFTALGIMQLVETGKLDLDGPIQQYIPWFQIKGEGPSSERASTITIRQLLYQTSGISELSGNKRILFPNTPGSLDTSIRWLADESITRVPGTAFEYSNTNYDILGLLIETVSGQSYERYLEESILTPLKMTHTYTSLQEAVANGMASGHIPFFGFPVVYDSYMPYTRAVLPSAGLISSAEDLSHYLLVHLNGGQYQDAQILSPAGVEALHTPGVIIEGDIGYAMGWVVFSFEEAAGEGEKIPTGVTHFGSWAGFLSRMVLVPEKEVGIVVLMNTGDEVKVSAYTNLGWDVALLAMGKEPAYFLPEEDFITRNGRAILAAVILLLIAENLLLSRRRKQFISSQNTPGKLAVPPEANRVRALFVLLPYLIELALAGFVLFVSIPGYQTTLPVMFRFAPDIGLLYAGILLLAVGVGTLRTVFWLIANRKGHP